MNCSEVKVGEGGFFMYAYHPQFPSGLNVYFRAKTLEELFDDAMRWWDKETKFWESESQGSSTKGASDLISTAVGQVRIAGNVAPTLEALATATALSFLRISVFASVVMVSCSYWLTRGCL